MTMVIHLFEPDYDDPYGPFGPIIRRWIPEPEEFDPDEDIDGGQHEQDWYWPHDYKRAA